MQNSSFKNSTTQKISSFLFDIGIGVFPKAIDYIETFLPGIRIIKGEIFVDEDKILSPGDILHEAGHLAILNKEVRKNLTDSVVFNEKSQAAEEMAAIAWSWAALEYLNIAPEVVFHPKGYNGGSESIIDNFSQNQYFGVPILAHKGLCVDGSSQLYKGGEAYPKMIKWTID